MKPIKVLKCDIGHADLPVIALTNIDRYCVALRSSDTRIRYRADVLADRSGTANRVFAACELQCRMFLSIWPEDQILEDFPELTREDINACFAFAADRERKLFVAPA